MEDRRFLLRSEAGIDHYIVTHEDGSNSFLAVGETDPIIEHNKAAATHNDGYSPSRELRRAASIPFVVGLKWLNEEGWWFMDPANSDRLVKKLNDPDWAHLRTAPGRIGYSNGVIR